MPDLTCCVSVQTELRNIFDFCQKITGLSDNIGGSRGGVEGVATPPLSSICLVFCLILPKIIRKIVFLRS